MNRPILAMALASFICLFQVNQGFSQGLPSSTLGATTTSAGTTFQFFSPTATAVSVDLYSQASGSQGRVQIPMQPIGNGIWSATTSNSVGKYYTYQITAPTLDSSNEVLDPYANSAVESFFNTRGYIEPSLTPLSYGPAIQSPTDAVIYELHVRDFTVSSTAGVSQPGLYTGLTQAGTILPGYPNIKTALDHLTELGVTHVQLMPVMDFQETVFAPYYNWGYCTTNFFSPNGMYATGFSDDSRIQQFRSLVNALHARGIGVILDVVYNHTGGTFFQSVAPNYYYRFWPDGSLANGADCGNEFKSESPMGSKLILDSVKYWMTQYGIDGFRFDLMSLIDQGTMTQVVQQLRAINPNVLVYGEPWTCQTPLTNQTDYSALKTIPVGAFNGAYETATTGGSNNPTNGWLETGANAGWLQNEMFIDPEYSSPGQSINYLCCHDGLSLWDKMVAGMPQATNDSRLAVMKVGFLTLLTSQGVPFLTEGDEFARTKGGNSNSYNAGDSVNKIDWTLKSQNYSLFTYVQQVIALRKNHPLFRLRTTADINQRLTVAPQSSGNAFMITVDGTNVPQEPWQKACVLVNRGSAVVPITLPPGNWLVGLDAMGGSPKTPVSGALNLAAQSGLVLYQTSGSTATPPVITNASTASGNVNQAFSFQVTASNNPTSFTATGLPNGLTFNPSTGLIWGTPTAVGTSSVQLAAANASGTSPTATLILKVTAAGSGSLTLVSAAPATPNSSVNLTALGVSDWRQWGQSGTTASNYFNGNIISDQAPLVSGNAVYPYGDNTTSFSWTNGHPTASSSGVRTGDFTSGINGGFKVTLQSSPTLQTATLYVGGWTATGQLTASLGDGSATPITAATVSNPAGSFYEVYQISYSSTNSSPLTVKWTQTAGSGGNVTLSAIAVAPSAGSSATGSLSLVSVTAATANSTVNLTTQGTSDWRQWGQSGTTGSNCFQGSLISDQTPLVPANGLYQYGDNTTAFTWSNGNPVASVTGVRTGVYVPGLNAGFQVILQSSPTPRTATIYVGGWMSTGQLTASLGDGTAAPLTSATVSNAAGSYYQIYQIKYGSSNSSPLTVKWTQTAGSGNVTLSAIAVAPAAN